MAPTASAVLKKLKRIGTAQNRKIYARHGFGTDMYGVSYANLGKLKKELKINHALAVDLWKSGNHDARVLAMMIADPGQVTAVEIDGWMRDAENYAVADAVVGVVVKSRFAEVRREKWLKARGEWFCRGGWHLVNGLARSDGEVPNRVFVAYLNRIEKEVGTAKNRAREAMNYALISIGVRNDALHRRAIATAKRIGPIDVDHGETGCKTPDPIPYMERTIAHKRAKAARAMARRKKTA